VAVRLLFKLIDKTKLYKYRYKCLALVLLILMYINLDSQIVLLLYSLKAFESFCFIILTFLSQIITTGLFMFNSKKGYISALISFLLFLNTKVYLTEQISMNIRLVFPQEILFYIVMLVFYLCHQNIPLLIKKLNNEI